MRICPAVVRLSLWLWMAMMVVLAGCGASAGFAQSKDAYGPGYPATDTAAEAPMSPPSEPSPAYASDDRQYDMESEVSGGGPPPMRESMTPRPPPPQPGKIAQVEVPAQPADTKAPAQPADTATATDAVRIRQMLIYSATLRMAVFEVNQSLDAVEQMAREMGGFLAHRTDTQITIRVPANKFEAAMKSVTSKGDVLQRNVEVQDVTEQYLDVMLRLKNARQVRDRIAELLQQSKTVEDSLKVERELARLSSEIERLEGRLKFLQDRVMFSTITVNFEPVRVDDPHGASFRLPFPWLEELGLGRLMSLQ